jgi:hypothetical protein
LFVRREQSGMINTNLKAVHEDPHEVRQDVGAHQIHVDGVAEAAQIPAKKERKVKQQQTLRNSDLGPTLGK